MNLSQEGLAQRPGVSWSSLKGFERTGLIAFDSQLRLARVLDCPNDFDRIRVDQFPDLATLHRKGRRK
jgi:hypothetical protein